MQKRKTRSSRDRGALGLTRTLCLAATIAAFGIAAGSTLDVDAHPVLPGAAPASRTLDEPANPAHPPLVFLDSLIGRSGKLRARFLAKSKPDFGIAALQRLFGDSALSTPGVYTVSDSASHGVFAFITMLPFSAKRAGRIGAYRIGNWPHERRSARAPMYAHPEGFIEVTPENADTYVSEHFKLSDFLTHDQQNVWPKYLVLNERLIDKLELVIEDLNAHGVPVQHLAVMSGFRTPEYNVQGVGEGGRARDSRHQYGDAADVFVDNDGDGRMDDLNHDGRIDTRDAKVIRDAVDRVEAAHPELVGGVGVYRSTASHGPFAHVDARGFRARWGRV